ncbi:MAG: glycine cleavage T C-terminal barrel domain-containing protein, partial [Arenicellales bacterium WSBS_2016_MAG_OTU3]
QLDNKALLALQGPKSAQVMASLGGGVGSMGDWFFMQSAVITLAGVEVLASRAGYTGEDGFEISVQESDALPLAQALLGHEDVLPIGLGARDSLRLEAGLCLYGHDIDTHTTPIEAGLNWAISRVRRKNGARAGGFPGADKILDQLESGVSQKRVGLKPVGRAPLREGVLLVDSEGNNIGKISSGGFGPSIEAPVAMAYLNSQLCDAGTTVFASVRGKTVAAEVAKLPFVAHNYCRGHSS